MQKFFTRKRSLARKAAAMMSAVMLFTSEAGVFLESAAVVNAADDEAQEDAAEESGTVSAADGAFPSFSTVRTEAMQRAIWMPSSHLS